ncbi:MAG: hypothetical protein GY870_14295 [archaeon]|nr:hypothetical protein [archaeon]
MKYEKNSYSEGFDICSWIIAGAVIVWSINDLLAGSLWGLLWLGIGGSCLLSNIYKFTNRGKLRNIVLGEFTQNPHISIGEICQKTGISHKDVQAIILDLKGSGLLLGTFSATTGQMEDVSVQPKVKASQPQPEVNPEQKNKFCPFCGSAKSQDDAQFCSHCGSQL